MTTVGYGDVYPITIAGKVVAAVTMVTGLLVIAFPITIIGVNLNDIYDEYREEQAKQERAVARERAKQLARERNESTTTLTPTDLKGAINELMVVQQKIHEELDGMRTRLARLVDVEIHAEAMLDHLKRAQELNEAMIARARLKAASQAGLGAEEETVPIMPTEASDDEDDGTGVESFTSSDILRMEPLKPAQRNRWKGAT